MTELTAPPIAPPVSPPMLSPTFVMPLPIWLKMPLMTLVTAKYAATVRKRSFTTFLPSAITLSGSSPSVTPRVIMAICPAFSM